jgi:DHA2 family multidrug resistance protein
MNLPVGILAFFLVFTLLEDPPFLRRATLRENKIDYIGFGLLTIGVAFLQIVLD